MNELFSSDPVLANIWLIYWISALMITFASVAFSMSRLAFSRDRHLWSLIFLQIVLAINLFFNFVAELNWHDPMLSDVSRIGAMIFSSLMIVCVPEFVNSYEVTCLNRKIGQFFRTAGFALVLHYLASSIFFFSVRYDGSFKYFGGYRYIPAYTVFIIQGLAMFYGVVAWFAARAISVQDKHRIKILRLLVISVAVLFPLSFVFDLVRYFFPRLWQPLTEERLFIHPFSMALTNVFLSRYASKSFSLNTIETKNFQTLSAREAEVANLLCDGHSYKEIARTLNISLSTVQTHTMKIYKKLGVNRKESLILIRKNTV